MTNVVDMIDVIHSDLGRVPRNIRVDKIAGYTTGSSDIQWSGTDWEKFPKVRKVRIDQSNDTAPTRGDVKDSENGAATIATAIAWAVERKRLGLQSTIYISSGSLAACEEAAKAADVSPHYWLADWNLDRETAASQLGGRIVAIQYASPTSNPNTLVPGTRLTISEVNCDLSVALASWLPSTSHHRLHIPLRHTVKKIHRKVIASTGGGGLGTALTAVLVNSGVHVTSTEGAAIASLLAMILGYLVPSAA